MDADQTESMKKVFSTFDTDKTGFVGTDRIPDILQFGANFEEDELDSRIADVDKDKAGKVNFDQFVQIVMTFLEEEDDEALAEELKEAFRMYDKEGQGYITTQVLKDIMKELDPKLTKDELEQIVNEVDEDGSGTVDFDEFMEMMTG